MIGVIIVTLALLAALTLAVSGLFKNHEACKPEKDTSNE